MNKITKFDVPKSPAEARQIQSDLRGKVSIVNDFGEINLIAGIDVGYDVKKGLAHAAIAVIEVKSLKPVKHLQVFTPVDFPYISGLLAFREIPAILEALDKLTVSPDLLMLDGQGVAHPRRMGIAAHVGVLLDKPSIGVAKSRLIGKYIEPGPLKGSASPLMDGGEQIGVVLRSRDNTRPLFISPGHRVDVDTALKITLKCLTNYRLPEPTRIADKFSKVKTGTLI